MIIPNNYYVLRVEDPEVGYRARLDYKRDDPLRSWMTGKKFDKDPDQPIKLELVGTDEENYSIPDLWLTPITIISKSFYKVLIDLGIKNLDTYEVDLQDKINDKVYNDFIAFNILDKVLSSGIEKSNLLLFRLEESVNVIIVHESVKDRVEKAGIDTLTFLNAEDIVI